MREAACLLVVLCMFVSAEAAVVVHFDFNAPKNTVETWEYADLSGNGHHANEAGTFYNYNGDLSQYADLQEDIGGSRGGVYAYRWALETDYDASLLVDPKIDGQYIQGSGAGAWDNNRLNLISAPTVAADAGITIALWVNPETDHVTQRAAGANADFAHLVVLGAYGDNPIATIELEANKHIHGWIEGDGADTQYEITGTGSVAADTWTHIAITYDRVNNVATTYINGEVDSTTAIPGVGDGVLAFAGCTAGGGLLTSHYETFLGMMDDIIIYDEVLTQEQILAIVNSSIEVAHAPDPYNGENLVGVNAVLHWQAPLVYVPSGYNVYVDPNELAVQNASPNSIGLFYKVLNQAGTTANLGSNLDYNTAYYWRVDALDVDDTYEGSVWEFTTQVSNHLTGDINKDGEVSLTDVAILSAQWLNIGSGWQANADESLKVDFIDYAKISSEWYERTAEDIFYNTKSLENWAIVDEGIIDGPSDWNVVGHELVELSNVYGPNSLATDNREGSYIYWKDPKSLLWQDYQFSVSLRSTDNDGIGVIFRYRDDNNYYKFDMDSQRGFRKLFKVYNGVETTIANVSEGYVPGQQMQLSVNVHGDRIDVLLDGVDVFPSARLGITDSDIPSGTVALYNWGNASTYFDDFLIHITRVKTVLATDDSYQADQNTTLEVTSGGVLCNDIVAHGSLTANLVEPCEHGNLTLNVDGTFTYTPAPDYVGLDSFVYEAVADNQDTDQAIVTIRIRSDAEFSIIVLPDTQNYSTTHPEIATSQTQWIVDNKDNFNIAFVLHEGDFTNYNSITEWDNADASMSVLDGNVPYVVVVGNHDDTGTGGAADVRDVSLFNQYFPVSRFDSLPQFGGVYEPGRMENSYHYFTAGGIDWLVLALEFGPRNEVLDWANQVVASHPHRRVIILTHNYMYSDDTLVGPGDLWNPHDYGQCIGATGPDACNDGEEMWVNFVKLHGNISFVFSGHTLNDGTGTLVSTGDNGNKVYQMLANYQFEANGGNGYLRIVTFCPDQQKVTVETYSPYLDQYRTEPDQQFEFLNVDLTTP
jgi:hypothetical protein